jgi:agmatinase
MALYYANSDFPNADIVILGVPYDRTSSFIPGSRFGPAYARIAADNVESYSPYQKLDLAGLNIHDGGDMSFADLRWPAVAAQIEGRASELLSAGKLPVFLGGEHSITGPIVAAYGKSLPDLAVIQFDAHADLRTEFLGEEHSHATAMFQAGAAIGPDNVFQYGIRSGTRDEFEGARHLHPFTVLEPLRRTMDRFRTRPVYLTIDIDVLDPGVMPAVSTPEPGGIGYAELIQAVKELSERRIVGVDIVEYNPLANRDPASASLAASLLREVILAAGRKRQ